MGWGRERGGKAAALHHTCSDVCKPCTTASFTDAITVNPIKLETGLRPNSAGIPSTVLLRIEAIGFPTFGLIYCTC